MHGNVREWCADWMTVYSANAETDPTGESSGYNRMLRGGSWDMDPTHLRSYDRDMASPANRFYFLGLRIVAVVGTP
jgi:formylglycine-generating enzyme required for sulfatase activity